MEKEIKNNENNKNLLNPRTYTKKRDNICGANQNIGE
jgi:hypothetical protein